jgi:hypothetical protein
MYLEHLKIDRRTLQYQFLMLLLMGLCVRLKVQNLESRYRNSGLLSLIGIKSQRVIEIKVEARSMRRQ